MGKRGMAKRGLGKAETLSVTLTPEMVKAVEESVAAGEFATTSDVLRDAMRVWQREREEHAERLASIKARINASIDDPRPRIPIEDVQRMLATTKPELLRQTFE